MAEQTTPYEFKMKAKGVMDLEPLPIRAFKSINLTDSILEFYPTATVDVNDSTGLIADNYLYIEGLQFETKYGSKDTGYIESSYIWSGNEYGDVTIDKFISGTNRFNLINANIKKDVPRGNAWKEPLCDVAYDILKNKMEHKGKYYTEASTGITTQYQMGRHYSTFIETLADSAYSKNFPNSPFFTFINSKNIFYFASIGKLFSQNPVKTLYYDMDSFKDKLNMKNIHVLYTGYTTTKELYTQKIHYINTDGNFESETKDIKDQFYKIDKNHRLMISKDNYKEGEHTSIRQVGYIDKKEESYHYKGIINNLYTNMNIMYQMVVVVEFDPSFVSGETLTLNISSPNKRKNIGTEYSGKWLIMGSTHLMDIEGSPYAQLTLCKPAIPLDKNNPMKNDLIT